MGDKGMVHRYSVASLSVRGITTQADHSTDIGDVGVPISYLN